MSNEKGWTKRCRGALTIGCAGGRLSRTIRISPGSSPRDPLPIGSPSIQNDVESREILDENVETTRSLSARGESLT